MSIQYFNPFQNLYFNEDSCFLTGAELNSKVSKISIFPEWVIERFGYRGKKFSLMDTYHTYPYEDFKLPCAPNVKLAFDKLEKEIEAAFDKGYEGMSSIDEEKLFLWTGKMVYGILYYELLIEKEKMERRNSELKLSSVLTKKFSLFHLMLQSLITPITFGEKKPWSISLVKLKYSKDIFHFRDSTVNLHFSLGVNDFGIIVCFQDNGIIKSEHTDILDKINGTILHPVQFEELCARFLYSDYIMKYIPKSKIKNSDKGLLIEAEPIPKDYDKEVFGKWEDKMFAQVLANYWEVWGLTMQDIHKPPNGPISFLENPKDYTFISPEQIKLPF